MKKLLKKKYFIPLLVVAVVAISATVAYAWWTTTVSSGPNTISTGDESLLLGGSLPITAAGLVPQAQLDNDPNSSVAGYQTSFFYVQNTGTNPVDFVGWLDNGTGDYGVLGSQVWVKITIAPTLAQGSPWDPTGSLSYNPVHGPYLVYEGPIGNLYGQAYGSQYLTTLNPHTPLAAGQYAFYRVVTWLDGPSSDNSSKNKTMTATLNFAVVPSP